MSDLKMLCNFSVKHSNKLKAICQPLSQYFGINHFLYSRTTENGDYVSIGSNPEMHEFYFSTGLFQHSPFFRNPSFIKPGIYSYRGFKDPNFLDSIDKGAQKLQVELGLGIVYRQGTDLIRIGYATPPIKDRDVFQDVFINNLPLLKKFNEYFIREAEDLIFAMGDNCINLPSEVGELYHKTPENFGPILSSQEKADFLHTLGYINKNLVNSLSPREIECLKYLCSGLTASQTAVRLGISPRTVEHHFNSIKSKLKCFSKGDLIPHARLIDMIGLFDL